MRCPDCGFDNPPGMKFCGECGTSLLARPRAEAERRQLTVMFCDLVGSTALSARLDPEDMRQVVLSHQETCASVVRRFDGYIAQYLGDGILVYFGYPMAHEDDAKRAVHAALGIIDAVEQLSAPLSEDRDARLAVRIGIHTGLVVVGEVGGGDKHEQLALGETPNVAARLQSLAEANSVVISGATYQLVQGLFECRDLGFHPVKGAQFPVRVYRVLAAGRVRGRLDIADTSGLTQLVGREQEVRSLAERWEQVRHGTGQVLLLVGEAGIGKSRLVHVLKQHTLHEAEAVLEGHGSPYYQHTGLYPIIQLLERALAFGERETPLEKLGKIEAVLEQYGIAAAEAVPLLAPLLSVPLANRYAPLNLSPQRQKQQTYELLITMIRNMAARRPVLLIVEDLHWVDPSTREWLGLLFERHASIPVLIVLTSRPEFTPPWGADAAVTVLHLVRLAASDVAAMVEHVAGGKTLPDEILRQLIARTDGNPLYVEEMTKTVIESGLLREEHDCYDLISPLASVGIPATLQDSLMARLDRLATIKEVAQLGATFGRQFSFELIKAVSTLDEATLEKELSRLVGAELLTQDGLPPHATYMFKHALIQEAAYESLLKSKRQQLHRIIVLVVEAQFQGMVETQPELLAHHCLGAGLARQAIVYSQKAGQKAVQRWANLEAITHFRKCLDLLESDPESPDKVRHELQLLMSLGVPLIMTKGYSSPEVAQTYNRARELCRRFKESSGLFSALNGLWFYYLVRAEHDAALELAEELLALASKSSQADVQILDAHNAVGVSSFYLGNLVACRQHLEQSIALYDPKEKRPRNLLALQDPGLFAYRNLVWDLWFLGYPDLALRRSLEATELAREQGSPFEIAVSFVNQAVLHWLRREPEQTAEQAEAAIRLASEQSYPFWLGWANVYKGWAVAEQGRLEEGLALIQAGQKIYERTGARISRTSYVVCMARVLQKHGRIADALRAVDDALETGRQLGEHYQDAELYRLKGGLVLGESPRARADAEACFREALRIASHQSAKMFELRTAADLYRLLRATEKERDALRVLRERYEWFTEGYAEKDLLEAKALIDQTICMR